jgi:hypothetical protein
MDKIKGLIAIFTTSIGFQVRKALVGCIGENCSNLPTGMLELDVRERPAWRVQAEQRCNWMQKSFGVPQNDRFGRNLMLAVLDSQLLHPPVDFSLQRARRQSQLIPQPHINE